MKTRGSLLVIYRQVLRLYPMEFQERFVEEMMQIADAAEAAEWPLIFVDTSIAIVRSWLRRVAFQPMAVSAMQGQYLSLGDSLVKPVKLLQGLGVATIVALLACCLSMITVWHFPTDCDYGKCGNASAEMIRR